MAYQPPIVATSAPRRPHTPRTLLVAAGFYLVIALSYSVGYGQTIAQMATTSADAARILSRGDYSGISGADSVVGPFVRIGIADAAQFKPKNPLFGLFSPLWSTSAQYRLARQNAGLVQVTSEIVLPGALTGATRLKQDDRDLPAAVPSQAEVEARLNQLSPAELGKVKATLDSVDQGKLRRLDPDTISTVKARLRSLFDQPNDSRPGSRSRSGCGADAQATPK